MAEWLNLDHFDLGTFVDYVHALKQERDALRAQLPSQGGEAVEVVAWRTNRDEDSTFPRLHKTEQEAKYWVDVCNVAPAITHEPLMTVAQHQRIMAAQRIKTCIALKERNDAREALTHPADQVADDLTMVKASRELLEQIAVELEHDNDRYFLGRELRALLAKSEGVKK